MSWRQYIPAIIPALVLCVLVAALFPVCQYYVDPDATAYLTIAWRYAAGDTARAINGYWSPWACWLTAAGIKWTMQPMVAAIIVNTLAAMGYQLIAQSFLLKFDVHRAMQWMLQGALTVFLLYAVYEQSFDDLWECFFLLCSLRLLLTDGYTARPLWWVASGALGALAYFAKAYSFPFFMLNTIACTYLITTERRTWIRISLVSIVAMVVCSLPWILALHTKYGKWTTGTAGSLNLSWYLVGHPQWKEGIKLLLPPVYNDSPYYWEDPYVVNGATPHAWSSLKLAGIQVVRLAYNMLKLVISLAQLSFAAPLAMLLSYWIIRSQHATRFFDKQVKVVALSVLLFPVGYLLINFEARYLWYMLPLLMVLAAKAIEHPAFNFKLPQMVVVYLLPISFALYPLSQLPLLINNGKAEYELATAMRASGINGSFTGTAHARTMSKLAYFSGNPYYNIPTTDTVTNQALLQELRRYKVKYYLDFTGSRYTPAAFKAAPLTDENGKTFPAIPLKGAENVRVYLIEP